MKNSLKLGIVLGIAVMMVTACEKDITLERSAEELQQEVNTVKALGLATSGIGVLPGDVCGMESYDLIAGKTIPVGHVDVANNATDLYVRIWADEGYLLTEAHVFAGDIEEMPVNKPGNPKIGHFPYAFTDSVGTPCIVIEIPLSEIEFGEDGVDVAVHAVVINAAGTFHESAWARGVSNENAVFAMKAVFGETWPWGITTANVLTPNCEYSNNFGYYEIDLATFTSDTFDLNAGKGLYYDESVVNGTVVVTLEDGKISFLITPANPENEVNSSYLYYGSEQGLLEILDDDACLPFWAFRYQQFDAAPHHFYKMKADISDCDLDSRRWGFYIPNHDLCW